MSLTDQPKPCATRRQAGEGVRRLNSLDVETSIRIWGRDGDECPEDNSRLIVRNYWQRHLVVLELDGKSIAVNIAELRRGIDNATN